jgi:hypothetical protein
MSAALRARRVAAARALAGDARRGQPGWDDLGAWPGWAALEAQALDSLMLKSAAWLHASTWRGCIRGALLKQVQQRLGDVDFARLMAPCEDDAPAVPLPDADRLDEWLLAEGREVLLASVGSAALRVLLRERLWPRTLPPLPARDTTRARRALGFAEEVR